MLAKRFGLNRSHDSLLLSPDKPFWLAEKVNPKIMRNIIQTTRIGISQAKDIPWRWYLKNSRSVSKRVKGDKTPSKSEFWLPSSLEGL